MAPRKGSGGQETFFGALAKLRCSSDNLILFTAVSLHSVLFRLPAGALRVMDSRGFILSVEKGDHNRIFDHSFVK